MVLAKGVDKSQEQVKKIQSYIKERVAHYKRLDGGVQFVETIPKRLVGSCRSNLVILSNWFCSASGKILRRLLRDEAREILRKSNAQAKL